MNDDEIEGNKMRNALRAIANEMQNLQNESITSGYNTNNGSIEIMQQILKYKAVLNLKKIQVKKLRLNLKTACVVAKTISSAKATETASLTSHLDFARQQYLDLVQKQNEYNEKISNLSTENHRLRDQLEFFNNVIQLGFKELQKIQSERVENVSTIEQLKHIIVSCGQYYADHYNEHERCTLLEQKNRFLNNKILIMKNNLEGALEELRNLRTSIKPNMEKRDPISRSRQCLGVVCSEYKIGSNQSNFTKLTMTKIRLNNPLKINITDLDLTTHLKTVKELLNDQDNLIQDMKSLMKIINNDES